MDVTVDRGTLHDNKNESQRLDILSKHNPTEEAKVASVERAASNVTSFSWWY
jgi:hypothetical protein